MADAGKVFGSLLVAKVQPSDIETLLEAMRDAGIGINARKSVHALIVRVLTHGVKVGWLGSGTKGYATAAAAVDRPTGSSKPRPHLLPADMRTFLDSAHDRKSHYADAYEVLFHTAARPGELLGLRWEDVNEAAEEVRVTGATARVYEGGKSHLERTLPKSESSVRYLKWGEDLKAALERQAARTGRAGYVFQTTKGGPVDPTAFNLAFRGDRDAAGLEASGLTPHGCRHSAISLQANWMLSPDGGGFIDWEALADFAGHADSKVTRAVYGHLEAAVVDAARRANLTKLRATF